MSTSSAQTASNQANATHSTGPVTEAGKNTVRTNALTHGLTSRLLILPGEDQADFDSLRATTLTHYQPAAGRESDLTEQLVQADWRLRRARRTEDALLNKLMTELMKTDPDLSVEDACASVFTTAPHSVQWRLFMRYLTAAERTYVRLQRELEKIQKIRKAEEAAAENIERMVRAVQLQSGFVSQKPAELSVSSVRTTGLQKHDPAKTPA
jgi:hypothetical protein